MEAVVPMMVYAEQALRVIEIRGQVYLTPGSSAKSPSSCATTDAGA